MTVFNCYYFALFVFVPINVIWLGESVIRQQYAYETFGPGDLSTAISIFISYALFGLGYWFKSQKQTKVVATDGQNSFSLCDSTRVARMIFLFGVVLTAIYVAQIGGVSEGISKAGELRSGEFAIESKFIGYRHLSQFSADALVLFVAVILGKRVKKIRVTTSDKMFLAGGFLFFVYYALSTAGRRPFIYPIVLCYLIYASLGGRAKKISVAALVVIVVIAGLGSIMGPILISGSWSTLFEIFNINDANWRALSEIAYDDASQGLGDSYIHFVAAQKASLWQFGFLTDIANLPRDFLPSRLLGFERSQQMPDAINEFILGHSIEDDLSGGETLGLHGYLLVNFGYVGMFILFFVLGVFYKTMHLHFQPTDPKDAVAWLIYWWFVLGFFVYFREGLLIFVLKTHLTWWLTTGLLFYNRSERQSTMPMLTATRSFGGPA